MWESYMRLLQSRKNDLFNLVKHPEIVIDILYKCNLAGQNCSFDAVIDQICHNSTPEKFTTFCIILLITGNCHAFSILSNSIDTSSLKAISLPEEVREVLDPRLLATITSTPALPAKLCLRKFSHNGKMNESKREFLKALESLLELKLDLEPVLIYLEFYEVFSTEQIGAIKVSIQSDIHKRFLEQLLLSFDIAFERFAHSLILSGQWILYGMIHGSGLLNLDLMEEISKIHLEFLCDKDNKENSFLAHSESISFGNPSVSPGPFGNELPNIREPDGILDFEVDDTDSRILASLYGEKRDEIYQNFSSPKGMALIINNRTFVNNYGERAGTEVDEENLRKLLTKLGYRVEKTQHNLSAESMLKSAHSFANHPDHKLFDSCVTVVLTHGKYDCLIGSDDFEVNVHDFLGRFNAKNAPYLRGKPKIFIFQACRGDIHDLGTTISVDTPDIGKISSFFACMKPSPSRQRNFNNNYTHEFRNASTEEPSGSRTSPTTTFPAAISLRPQSVSKARHYEKRPTEADMLIAFATTPRYVSWRNSNNGSWFIQSICEIFCKYAATEDICTLLTRVNSRVAQVYSSSNQGQKQIPEFVSRLQKRFFFFPGIHSPPNI